MAQGKWMMISWDDNTREYIAEKKNLRWHNQQWNNLLGQTRKRLIRNWVMLLMKELLKTLIMKLLNERKVQLNDLR